MKGDNHSETASRAATRRAAHQLWDTPRVLEDPVVLKIIGRDEEAALRAGNAKSVSALDGTVRAFMAARSRFAEDSLNEAVSRGVGQYVVLGAGLDTFAFRNPHDALRVFEIDHPATQKWKIARLADAEIAVPATVTFVPVDFTRQTLAEELPRCGWDAKQPTFFSWLGVTSYLPRAAVMQTLDFVAQCPHGSEIVFDVSTPASYVTLYERLTRLGVAVKLALAGEPNGTRFDPAALAKELRNRGFGDAGFLNGAALNGRYFAGRSDGLKVSNRSALIRATV
jgi:methyltransferase (TIGR00027 family)